MTRKELVDAIASSEIRLKGWRSDDQVAMWECEQLAAQISSLYDELASIDSLDALGNRVLENPEDYYDTDEVGNFPDLNSRLDTSENLIVISLYSDTVKTPYVEELNGIKEWYWSDAPLVSAM